MSAKRASKLTDAQLEERIMCKQLLALAIEFYANPKNIEAFELWDKNQMKEEITYG